MKNNIKSALSRRTILGMFGASALSFPGSVSVGKILSGAVLSPSEIFDAVPVPKTKDDIIFYREFLCSREKYLELKEKYRAVFTDIISCIPSDKRESINYEDSYFAKTGIDRIGVDDPNEGLSIHLELSNSESSERIMLDICDTDYTVIIRVYNINKGIKTFKGLELIDFKEAMELLKQPFDVIVQQIEKAYAVESEATNTEHDEVIRKIEEKGFRMQYGIYLNNSSLTPISQIVAGVLNNKIPLGFSMNHQIEQILHQK